MFAAIPTVVWTLLAQIGGYLILFFVQDKDRAEKMQHSWEEWLLRKQNEVASGAKAKSAYRQQIENIRRKRAEAKEKKQ